MKVLRAGIGSLVKSQPVKYELVKYSKNCQFVKRVDSSKPSIGQKGRFVNNLLVKNQVAQTAQK